MTNSMHYTNPATFQSLEFAIQDRLSRNKKCIYCGGHIPEGVVHNKCLSELHSQIALALVGGIKDCNEIPSRRKYTSSATISSEMLRYYGDKGHILFTLGINLAKQIIDNLSPLELSAWQYLVEIDISEEIKSFDKRMTIHLIGEPCCIFCGTGAVLYQMDGTLARHIKSNFKDSLIDECKFLPNNIHYHKQCLQRCLNGRTNYEK